MPRGGAPHRPPGWWERGAPRKARQVVPSLGPLMGGVADAVSTCLRFLSFIVSDPANRTLCNCRHLQLSEGSLWTQSPLGLYMGRLEAPGESCPPLLPPREQLSPSWKGSGRERPQIPPPSGGSTEAISHRPPAGLSPRAWSVTP